MARDESPPFERGTGWYQGGTIDSNNLDGVNYEGKEYEFEDSVYFTGHKVRVRVVRNTGAVALRGSKLAQFDLTTFFPRRITGYAAVGAQFALPIDELHGAAGIAVNDLGYVVVRGPCAILTSLAGDGTDVISVGDRLVAQTAATSGATTAGRVITNTITAASTFLGTALLDQSTNMIGRAMSAATTANTNTGVAVLVGSW